MELTPNTILAHYRIISKLGAGGMGDVYLAQDTKLDRKVALKVLPADIASNQDRMERFIREAKSAAALNHPNIATIHEIGDSSGTNFIAMEFIDGSTLREEIHLKQTSLKKLLRYLQHVAEGLAKAHAAGIVHRDLKPDNIMITRDGHAKILDFGLAKLVEPATANLTDEVSEGATVIMAPSLSGAIMGTVGYMSPEQAQGKTSEIDHRSDIFSFGCLLYEAITGHKAFHGKDAIDSLNKIIREPVIPIHEFIESTPPDLERIVRRCLAKDPDERYQTIKDVAIELKEVRRELPDTDLNRKAPLTSLNESTVTYTSPKTSSASTNETAVPTRTSSVELAVSEIKQQRTRLIGGLLLLGVLAVAAYWFFSSRSRSKSIAWFQAPQISQMTSAETTIHAAISPDGKYVAHVESSIGQQGLWIRQVSAANDIQVVAPLSGGYYGLTFSNDGNDLYYVFNTTGVGVLYRVPALGGVPTKLLENVDSPVTFSPDGKQMAFVRSIPTKRDESALVIVNVDGTEERSLAVRRLPESFSPLYFTGPSWSPDGKLIAASVQNFEGGTHVDLVVFRAGDGSAQVLNKERWPYIGRVQWTADSSGLLMVAGNQAFRDSELVYISYPGGETRNILKDFNGYRCLSLTVDGKKLITVQMSGRFTLWSVPINDVRGAAQIDSGKVRNGEVSVGPDGSIVFIADQNGNQEVFVTNAEGAGRKQLSTAFGHNFDPIITKDGRYVVFTSDRLGYFNIWRIDADGGNPVRLTKGIADEFPASSPDGRWVVYSSDDPRSPGIYKVSIDGGEPVRLTERAVAPQVSPDGKLIVAALLSDPGGPKLAIIPMEGGAPIKTFDFLNATNSAVAPAIRWARDGQSILYSSTLNNISNVWSQPIDGSKPKQITDFKDSLLTGFDISPDGKRLICARGLLIRNAVLLSDPQ